MRPGPGPLIAALILAGCLGGPGPAVTTEATPIPEPGQTLFNFTGATTFTFLVDGPKNFIALNATDEETKGAVLFIYAEAAGWHEITISPAHPNLVKGPVQGVHASTSAVEGIGSATISFYGPEWWNTTVLAVAMAANEAGGSLFELALEGENLTRSSEFVTGEARFIPPEAWTGDRYIVPQWPIGPHVGNDLKVWWTTTRGTVAAFSSTEYAQGVRYEDVRLYSTTKSWASHGIAERQTGTEQPLGGEDSLDPRGFFLISPETEWHLEIGRRTTSEPVYDALLVADLTAPFFPTDALKVP